MGWKKKRHAFTAHALVEEKVASLVLGLWLLMTQFHLVDYLIRHSSHSVRMLFYTYPSYHPC